MRITKSEYALRLAETAALRSEDPHLQVGAVVLDKAGRVLSTGYNGLSAGLVISTPEFWNNRDAKSMFMIHAELNALSYVSKTDNPFKIAITHSPCLACAKAIVASGIKEVSFRTLYDREPQALEVLRFHKLEITF